MREFREDYGVYICDHVFRNEEPVLEVIRDFDGYWQFLCGNESDTEGDCHLVGVGHLIKRDPSLKVMAELDPGFGAERAGTSSEWEFFELDED